MDRTLAIGALALAVLVVVTGLSSIKLTQQPLILLVDPVLLLLDGLDDLVLCLGVVWTAVAVAWDLVGGVLPDPFDLCHVHPGLGLRLDFDSGTVCIHVGGTSYILAGCSATRIEML